MKRHFGLQQTGSVPAARWVLTIVLVGSSTAAVLNGTSGQGISGRSFNRDTRSANYLPALRTIAGTLGERYKVRLLVDSAIALSAPLQVPDATLTLEQSLDELSHSNKDLVWLKIWLPDLPALPVPEKLRAAVRALERVTGPALVIEDLSIRQSIQFRRRSGPSKQRALFQTNNSKPFYLLFSSSATDDGKTIDERFADLQQQQLELMNRLDPDQRANPMLQWAQAVQHLDAPTLEHIMTPMAKAATDAWDSTPPDIRGEMIKQSMNVMQSYGAGGASGGSGHASQSARTSRGPRNFNAELIQIANSIGRPEKAKVLIDPALVVLIQPQKPSSDASFIASLDSLVNSVGSAAWRQVYVPITQQLDKAAAVAALCSEIRSLERIGNYLLDT